MKPDRGRIDLSDEAMARQWSKNLGCSREAIAAAIEKVGDNRDTVRKELGLPPVPATATPDIKQPALSLAGAAAHSQGHADISCAPAPSLRAAPRADRAARPLR